MDETSIKIIENSQKLFYKYGLKRITMDEIASHLRMSKKTIYQHFADKDALINGIAQHHMEVANCYIESLTGKSKDAIHEMIMISEYMVEMFKPMSPVFFYDLSKYYPQTLACFDDMKRGRPLNQIKDNFTRGIEAKLYRTDFDLEKMAAYRLAQMDIIFSADKYFGELYDPASLNKMIIEHFLYGITTVKGHKLVNKYLNKEEE